TALPPRIAKTRPGMNAQAPFALPLLDLCNEEPGTCNQERSFTVDTRRLAPSLSPTMQDTPDSESASALAPEATIIPEAPPPSPSSHPRSRLERAARLLGLFTTGQATVQLLNVAAGLILIRILTKEAYAQFTLGNTVLNVHGGLIEFGFAPAIMALVGERIHD